MIVSRHFLFVGPAQRPIRVLARRRRQPRPYEAKAARARHKTLAGDAVGPRPSPIVQRRAFCSTSVWPRRVGGLNEGGDQIDGLIAKGCLIVSCPAADDNPLHGFVGALAQAARDGGARALRASGPDDVAAAKAAGLPVIGGNRIFDQAYQVEITPDFDAAAAVARAGADDVAIDCTPRPRRGPRVAETVRRIRDELWVPVLADISTLEEGVAAAEEMGAEFVGTSLSGYTSYTEPKPALPDLKLIEELARRLKVPIIAGGRFNTPDLARRGLDAGAHAVVVGTMIANPREIARTFVTEMRHGGW
jgi:N-acylglucosamine-6-phosphate 2-epimerase/N-acetylmuramic acid 6-phosphate etherase